MNGLENWGGLCSSAVAAMMVATTGLVDWPVRRDGDRGNARRFRRLSTRQRIPQLCVRRAIIGAGLASTAWLIQRA